MMATACKICSLDPTLRSRIEEDMKRDMGPTNICNKYPEAHLNEGNVYSHRKHLAKVTAIASYERSLLDRVETVTLSPLSIQSQPELTNQVVENLSEPRQILNEVSPQNSLPVSSSFTEVEPIRDVSKSVVVPNQTTSLMANTGNWVLNDLAVLDRIISKINDPDFLSQVRPDHVLQAIRLKKELLVDEEKDDTKEVKLQLGVVLQYLSSEPLNPKVINQELNIEPYSGE